MTLYVEDLEAIEDRAARANRVRLAGNYVDLGVIASVVREDVPALVSLVRRATAELAQVVAERDRLKLALSDIATRGCVETDVTCNGFAGADSRCDRCTAARALEGRP